MKPSPALGVPKQYQSATHNGRISLYATPRFGQKQSSLSAPESIVPGAKSEFLSFKMKKYLGPCSDSTLKKVTVRNARGALFYFFLSLCPLFFLHLLILDTNSYQHKEWSAVIFYLPIVIIASLYCMRVAFNRNKGIIVDFGNDLIEFYGGGIPAAGVLDYIKPSFWVQAAKRYRIKISEITSISKRHEISYYKGNFSSSYAVKIHGRFAYGTVSIWIEPQEKCDELIDVMQS